MNSERNKNSKRWFRNWAGEYDKTLGKIGRHHKLLDLVVRLSAVREGDHVLDIGCGTGLLSLKFLDKVDCVVTGVDNSASMLKIFRSKVRKLGPGVRISCKLQSAEKLTFGKNSFDIAASTVSLHHVTDKYPVIKKIHDLLKPGGKFIIGEIDMDTTGNLNDPKRMLRILDYLKEEYILALEEGGIGAFSRMYDNGKKHIMNDGEYCIGFRQWSSLCKKAGFRKICVRPVPGFSWFKVLVAVK